MRNKLSQEELKRALIYDKNTGEFIWRKRDVSMFKRKRICLTWNSRWEGKKAGVIDGKGYISVSLFGHRIRAHRLAFLYITGSLPHGQVDHINGDRADNRWVNLRDVCGQDNQKNMKTSSRNKSGAMGVCWHKAGEKWGSSIRANGKSNHLGLFDDWFEAVCARKSAELKYGFHANHGRFDS